MPRLSFTATQGSADAFVEAEIQTGLQGQTRQAFRVKRISWEFDGAPPRPFTNPAGSQDVELCITRRTKAAMPAITDQDVIMKQHWQMQQAGAGTIVTVIPPFGAVLGIWDVPSPDAKKLDDGAILIVEDPLYVQLDSTATTLALVVVGVIDYDILTITELDRLTLLTQSLQ